MILRLLLVGTSFMHGVVRFFFVTGVSVDFHTFLRFDTCVACGFTTANYTPLFNVSG